MSHLNELTNWGVTFEFHIWMNPSSDPLKTNSPHGENVPKKNT